MDNQNNNPDTMLHELEPLCQTYHYDIENLSDYKNNKMKNTNHTDKHRRTAM